MSGYVSGVFVICLIFGALRLLSYGNSSVEMFAIGVITLSVILSPLSGAISDFDAEGWLESLGGEGTEVDAEYTAAIEEAFAEGIRSAVAEEFSLDRENIRVKLFGFNAAEMRAEKITVNLSGAAVIAEYRAMEKYLNRLDIGECNVSIEIR